MTKKKSMKKKAMKDRDDENIRKRLSPQGEGTVMDKATDLTSKKNMDKGTDLPTILNSSFYMLCDMVDKMKINVGNSIEKECKQLIL
jgi:hypothetical protein